MISACLLAVSTLALGQAGSSGNPSGSPPASGPWIADADSDGIRTLVLPAAFKSSTGVAWLVEIASTGVDSTFVVAMESEDGGLIAMLDSDTAIPVGLTAMRLWTFDAEGVATVGEPFVAAFNPGAPPPKPDLTKPLKVGGITYGGLDSLGRPTGVTGTLKGPPKRGAAVPRSLGNKYSPEVGHLLPQAVGGMPDPRNLVPLASAANLRQGSLDAFISQTLASDPGKAITVSIKPNYTGNETVPRSVTFIYTSSDGSLKIETTISNR